DHRGQVGGDAAQRGQGRGQAHASAERDDLRLSGLGGLRAAPAACPAVPRARPGMLVRPALGAVRTVCPPAGLGALLSPWLSPCRPASWLALPCGLALSRLPRLPPVSRLFALRRRLALLRRSYLVALPRQGAPWRLRVFCTLLLFIRSAP